MNYIDSPTFLKVRGGWINPEDISWVETVAANELMLKVGITGREKPIILNESDSAMMRLYLDEHTWLPELDEEEGELEDAV